VGQTFLSAIHFNGRQECLPHDMTPLHDLFVGIVAILFGGLLVLGAIINSRPLMSLSKLRLLAEAIGPTAARGAIAAIGLASVAMGILIACGWRVPW
jgi:hypothetical protein